MKTLLIRCPYPYGKVQTWLPMDLHKIAASFEAGGTQTDVVDLNFEPLPSLEQYDHIGIGVIGMPYIPISRRIAQEVYEQTGKKPLIGGQIIQAFRPDEFQAIFPNAVQISGHISDNFILKSRGIEAPPVSDVSVAERIKQMPDDLLKKYLENDFGFYVSQGCKHKCSFCAIADKGKQEEFSKPIVMEKDLDALCESAQRFGLPKMNMYLSSLDLFQNPSEFKNVLGIFARAREKYNLNLCIRGLSRIDSFLKSLEKFPELYTLIPASGLHTVGFGVDGTTEKIWREQHKGNKSLSDVEKTFVECRKVGITPESLMVTGFHNEGSYKCDVQELERTVKYSIEWAEKYGAVCRPHVAKDCSPNNKGWESPKWASLRARLVENPEMFINLDYLMEASDLSHPDPESRAEVNKAYWTIVNTLKPRGLCATYPLKHYRQRNKKMNKLAYKHNAREPFDR